MDADTKRGFRARLKRPKPERTSEVLRDIAVGEGDTVTFRAVLLHLKHRAFGFTVLIFALPCCLPMPPGIPTVCGFAIVVIALNLIAARQRLWLPSAIADKAVARADLKRMVDRVAPYMEKLEHFCKPRLAVITDSVGKVVIGIVLLVLGLIMILPIPLLGNMPPGFAASIIAIGMTERDGLIVLLGLLVSVAAIAVVAIATRATVIGILNLVSV
jgi:hypothetical protein